MRVFHHGDASIGAHNGQPQFVRGAQRCDAVFAGRTAAATADRHRLAGRLRPDA